MMHKISILYSWFIRTITYFFPNHPFFMRMRGWLYSLMMDECGANFQVASSTTLNSLTGLKIGENVYIAHNTVIIGIEVEIGHNVIIGPNCVISAGNHQFDGKSFRFLKSTREKVTIHSGSWVAGNCTLIGGSVLPKRCILAGGSVLTKTYSDDNTIYGGVPAKKIGEVT